MRFSALPVRLSAFLTLATLLSFTPAVAADDEATCANASGDEKIAACTRVIDSGLFAGSGLAWAYTNRGNAYRAKGDNDRDIQDQDQAIRLDPNFAAPYNNRGTAYHGKGDNDRAIQDYDQAIRLDPKYAFAYNNRGNSYLAKGDNDRAVADYSEAIAINPNYALAYRNRGRLYFFSKAVAKAQADFKQASELNPKDAYAALWLDLTERRNNLPSHLAQAATQLDMTVWPAPVVRLFLGQMTPAGVLDAAQNADAYTMKGQVCEANFYSGEWALQQGTAPEASRLFRLAASDCPLNYVEHAAATAELKRFGVAP